MILDNAGRNTDIDEDGEKIEGVKKIEGMDQ